MAEDKTHLIFKHISEPVSFSSGEIEQSHFLKKNKNKATSAGKTSGKGSFFSSFKVLNSIMVSVLLSNDSQGRFRFSPPAQSF